MRIYVGRWDMLPEDWAGYNGLSEKDEEEVKVEVDRQWVFGDNDRLVGTYTPKEFEATFNQTLVNHINSNDYWIRIFE